MRREKRAFRKINRILSGLDPDTAAALARRFMEFYGRPVFEQHLEAGGAVPPEQGRTVPPPADRSVPPPAAPTSPKPAEQPVPVPAAQPASEDTRPSFLRTQYRMEVGKQLVEYLNKEESRDRD